MIPTISSYQRKANYCGRWYYALLQMILSTEAYIILPPIISQIAESTSPWAPMITSLAICMTAVLLVTKASVVITSALLCSLACITFICPMWLVRIQKYKAQINGPWDEAIPKLSMALMKKA
jgi:phosphatidylinositol glycan class C protein